MVRCSQDGLYPAGFTQEEVKRAAAAAAAAAAESTPTQRCAFTPDRARDATKIRGWGPTACKDVM
jgi:hypothetical protein